MTSNGFTNRTRLNTSLCIFQLALVAQKIDLFANQQRNACHPTINVMEMMIVETTVTKSTDVLVIEIEMLAGDELRIFRFFSWSETYRCIVI